MKQSSPSVRTSSTGSPARLSQSSGTSSAALPSSPATITPSQRASAASEEQEPVNQDQLRVWAVAIENEIFRDANAELIRYAKALEEELILRRGSSDMFAGCHAHPFAF
jgi:hypothetical protein